MATSDAPSSAIARPVLSGHREVAALWLPDAWYDEATRRRLVLQAWRAGCTLARFEGGDLLRFATAFAADCETLPGWPLQRLSGTLCSADIAPQQLAGRVHADVLLAIGAEWRALNLADAASVDPAQWLDVSTAFVEMADCRLPPAERVVVEPPARDLREVLGAAVPGAPAPETSKLLKALAAQRQRNAQPAAEDRRAGHPGFGIGMDGRAVKVAAAVAAIVLVVAVIAILAEAPDSGSGSSHGLSPAVLAAFGFLVFNFLRRGSSGAAASKGTRPGAATQRPHAGAPREGLLARARRALRTLPARATGKVVPQRWRNWATRLAMTTGLASLLGAQHSAYMQRMLKMFDDGHLDDALRHAIPLGGDGQSLGQAFGRLTPRDKLALRQQRGASTSIGLGDELERHLRALYRRTFEQLDRKGRIDEAVFVLAELLNARQEALDYLEKHARFAQAAELALGWDMPAAQIVRLHALAGNWQVALLVARRDNALDAAVALLEKRWPEAAVQLRKEWGASLVARGQWLAAVHVVWRIESERPRAAEWLQVAEAAGGTIAARALALRAQCLPETLPAYADFIDALRDDPALVEERTALARELLQLQAPIDPMARRVAALVAGAVIADIPAVARPEAPALARKLVEMAGDAALSADMPHTAWPTQTRAALAQGDGTVGWFAPEAGTHAVIDVAPLPDGEFLVALGEAGAVRVDARGRWRARFAVPTHRIVIADDGRVALALAPRERVWRVSRLDLVRGQSEDLGMHEFDAFARGFDGIGWSVGIGNRVQVLDTTRGLREVLWQVADLPGTVVALDVFDDAEICVMRNGDVLHQWAYALPGRRLIARDELPAIDPHTVARVVSIGVGVIEFTLPTPYDETARVRPLAGTQAAWKDVPWHAADCVIAAAGAWLALREPVAADAAEQTIALFNVGTGRVHGRWFWPLGAQVKLRPVEDAWIAFDDQGRVSVVLLTTGELRGLSVR